MTQTGEPRIVPIGGSLGGDPDPAGGGSAAGLVLGAARMHALESEVELLGDLASPEALSGLRLLTEKPAIRVRPLIDRRRDEPMAKKIELLDRFCTDLIRPVSAPHSSPNASTMSGSAKGHAGVFTNAK